MLPLTEDQPAAIEDAAAIPAELVEAEPEFIAPAEHQHVAEEQPAADDAGAPIAPAADETAAAAHQPEEADEPAHAPAHVPHTYFPMHFAHSTGGSVAVANSFSTGKGNAYSHAVAYGSPKHHHQA